MVHRVVFDLAKNASFSFTDTDSAMYLLVECLTKYVTDPRRATVTDISLKQRFGVSVGTRTGVVYGPHFLAALLAKVVARLAKVGINAEVRKDSLHIVPAAATPAATAVKSPHVTIAAGGIGVWHLLPGRDAPAELAHVTTAPAEPAHVTTAAGGAGAMPAEPAHVTIATAANMANAAANMAAIRAAIMAAITVAAGIKCATGVLPEGLDAAITAAITAAKAGAEAILVAAALNAAITVAIEEMAEMARDDVTSAEIAAEIENAMRVQPGPVCELEDD
jgi:hypothetical protein